jgi:uncharacterized protein
MVIRREYHRAGREELRLAKRASRRKTRSMKTSLDHLPAGKRRELDHVIAVLREEFAGAIAGRKADGVKDGQILKIILYGSYARGDWVEDPVGRYFSDFDLLVVVSHEKLTDVLEFWEGAEKRLLKNLASGADLRTPVSLIVHSLDDVNDQLTQGRYFFVDIVREGIVLAEEPGHPFVDPQPLPDDAALKEAEKYYREHTIAADRFIAHAKLDIENGWTSLAAFHLHQAAESLYNAILLVATLYTPKSHNLVRLRNAAEPIDARLADVWPTDTKFQKRCFELLRAAYVKARYSEHYRVTGEELAWMLDRLTVLKIAVDGICRDRLSELRRTDHD